MTSLATLEMDRLALTRLIGDSVVVGKGVAGDFIVSGKGEAGVEEPTALLTPVLSFNGSKKAMETTACESHSVSVGGKHGSISGDASVYGVELLESCAVLPFVPIMAVGLSVGSISDVGSDSPSGGLQQVLESCAEPHRFPEGMDFCSPLISSSEVLFSQLYSEAGSDGELMAPISQLCNEDKSGGELMALKEGGGEFCVVPLRILHPGCDRFVGKGSANPSSWVSEMASSFRHLVGVSCDGYEFDLLNLFAALEMERGSGNKSPGRSGGKLFRELKSLECSVNYDGNASSSRKTRKVGRTLVNHP